MRETYYNNNLETNKKENQTSNKMFCDDRRIKKGGTLPTPGTRSEPTLSHTVPGVGGDGGGGGGGDGGNGGGGVGGLADGKIPL